MDKKTVVFGWKENMPGLFLSSLIFTFIIFYPDKNNSLFICYLYVPSLIENQEECLSFLPLLLFYKFHRNSYEKSSLNFL